MARLLVVQDNLKVMRDEWIQMDDNQRKPYERAANMDSDRYLREVQDHRDDWGLNPPLARAVLRREVWATPQSQRSASPLSQNEFLLSVFGRLGLKFSDYMLVLY